jgi:polysaccharide biosynthesis transport protein
MNKAYRFEPHRTTSDLATVLRNVWVGKWPIIAVTTAALMLAAAHIVTEEPRFRATAVLLLKDVDGRVVENSGAAASPANDDKIIATEAKVLQSRGIMRELVEKLSLTEDPEFKPPPQSDPWFVPAWLMDEFRRLRGAEPAPELSPQQILSATIDRTIDAIAVVNIPGTLLFNIHFESRSPEKAALIANTLLQLYLESKFDARSKASGQAKERLGEQVEELGRNLEAAEEELEDYIASTEMISPEALAARRQQMKQLRDRFAQAQERIESATTRMAALDNWLQGFNPEAAGAMADEEALAPLPHHDREVALSDTEAQQLRQAWKSAQVEKETEARLLPNLLASIADLESRIARQSDELVKLRRLEREVAASAAAYESALSGLKQLSVDRVGKHLGLRLLSEAEPPLMSTGPGAGVTAALAAALGLIVGVGLVLVRQHIRDSSRKTDEFERAFYTDTGRP